MRPDDPGRIRSEPAISGGWPLPRRERGDEHRLGDKDWCWCQPRVESFLNKAGEWCEIVIHQGDVA